MSRVFNATRTAIFDRFIARRTKRLETERECPGLGEVDLDAPAMAPDHEHLKKPCSRPFRPFKEAWVLDREHRERDLTRRMQVAAAEDAVLHGWASRHGMTSEELDPSPPGRKGHFMRLTSGTKYWPIDPRPEEVFIDDIAASLSRLCRFNGHVRDGLFYSVAEHSVLTSYIVPREWALEALLHDGSEFATGDVIRPIKVLPEVAAVVKPIEERNDQVIAKRFGLKFPFHPCIKAADVALCATELLTVMRGAAPNGPGDCVVLNVEPRCWEPSVAYRAFLDRFFELMLERQHEQAVLLRGDPFNRLRLDSFLSPMLRKEVA